MQGLQIIVQSTVEPMAGREEIPTEVCLTNAELLIHADMTGGLYTTPCLGVLGNHCYGNVLCIHAMCDGVGVVPVNVKVFAMQTFRNGFQLSCLYNPIISD